MVVTTALTLLLLLVHFGARLATPRGNAAGAATGSHPAGVWLLPFLVYGAINAAWISPVPWLGWLDWCRWAQVAAVFWVVLNGIQTPTTRRVLFATLVALAMSGVLLACYQRFVDPDWLMLGRTQARQFLGRGSGPFGVPNSFAALLLLLLPPVGALVCRGGASAAERIWWGWVTGVLVVGLLLTISRGAWIALVLALTVWPLAARNWTWRRRALVAGLVFSVILAAGTVVYRTAPRVQQRFRVLMRDGGERSRPIMWHAAWQMFREQPAWGSGAGSYNVLFERYRPEKFRDNTEWAHNDYLNTLSDYGLVGLALFLGGWGGIAVGALRARRRAEQAQMFVGEANEGVSPVALGIGLLAFALQLSVDFHFKIPALGLSFATLAALLVGQVWTSPKGRLSPGRNRAGAWIAMAGTVVIAWMLLPFLHGESLRFRAREAIDAIARAGPGNPVDPVALHEAHRCLARAVAKAPRNGGAWSDLAYATALLSHVDGRPDLELGRQAEAAANRALQCSGQPHGFWIRRGVALTMQGRWDEGGADFAHAVGLAPANTWAWYYYAEHLSRRSTERELAKAAVAFCLRLDPSNSRALALRQELAIGPKMPATQPDSR